MQDRQTTFELRDIDELIPYARNARTHSAEQVQKLAGSIKEFGFINPIIISEDGGVLAGHGRILAAKTLGIKQVPCVIESHLTEAQKKAYILADNRLALDAGWDEDMLRIELGELKDLDFDLDLIGFDDEELKRYFDEDEGIKLGDDDGEPEEEDAVEVDEESDAVCKPGDLWILGNHRLICGDSTDPYVVARVLDGANPNVMVTDPPYGVKYDPTQCHKLHSKEREGKVLNDHKADWTESYALFPGNVAYVWHAGLKTDLVAKDLRTVGYKLSAMIIWNKNCIGAGFGEYRWQHENCWYGVRGNHVWNGGADQSTVWDIKMVRYLDEGAWGHSTQKPIECMKRPIENNTDKGDWVYDPFLGSGTTIIAAERTGRKCAGCELSPNYCDAIIRRWQEETSRKAVLEGSGKSFDELSKNSE